MPKLEDYGFHRYLVSFILGGHVVGSVWCEDTVAVRSYRLHYQSEYEISVQDFTCFDEINGYCDFQRAKLGMLNYPEAVYCINKRKSYKSANNAYMATGDTRYNIKNSCKTGKPTPMGNIWRKLREL